MVGRDGHVEVAKAYYSVPPEYLGRTVWARWDARLVRVFNHRWEQIAVHVRHERGRFSTHGQHLHPHKISGLERGAELSAEQGELDRPAGAPMGPGDARGAGHRRHARAARAAEPGPEAPARSPGKSL